MSLTLSHQVERIAQQQNPNNPSTPESLIAIILVITMTNIHITLFIMCWYFGNCKKTKNEAQVTFHSTPEIKSIRQSQIN